MSSESGGEGALTEAKPNSPEKGQPLLKEYYEAGEIGRGLLEVNQDRINNSYRFSLKTEGFDKLNIDAVKSRDKKILPQKKILETHLTLRFQCL